MSAYRSFTPAWKRARTLGFGLVVALLAACNSGSKDSVKPAINLYNPPSDSQVSGNGWQLSGMVADNQEAAKLSYRINDGEERGIELTGLAQFRFGLNMLELKPGKNTITLTATDKAGNSSTRVLELNFAAATSATPVISLSTPSNNSTSSTNTVRLTGSATDDVSVTRMTFKLNNEPEEPMSITPGSSVSFNHTAGFLSPGANTISIIAYDGNGNRSVSNVTVNYGSAPPPPPPSGSGAAPTVSLSQPANGATVSTTTVRIQGTAGDDKGVTKLTFQLNDEPEEVIAITPSTSVSFARTIGFLKPGANTVTVFAYDADGNKGSSTVTVNYGSGGSNTPPTVSITQPTNGSSTASTSLAVRGTATDNASVTRMTYQLNGGAEQSVSITSGASVSFSFNASGFREGSNTLTVNAYDAANAKGSASVSFTFSSGTTPPAPPSGGANPTLLRSYMWMQSSPEGDQPAVEAMFYRPRQFTTNNTLTDAQSGWTINNAGSFQGWDVLLPPNGGKHGSVWQYDKSTFISLTLNRDARLAIVWRADPTKVPNWLKNNWTQQGTVRINNADRQVYVKNFSAGQAVELGSVYDPGQRQAQNLETYWVLFAEKDGTPPAEPPQLGSPAAEPNKACPQWVHDQYTTEVTMPNGAKRVLATWHPQVDPVYWCYFGHDHGSDPGLFKAGYKPAFGYIQDALHTDGVLPESHPGFKNYVWERDGYRWLFVHHFGTGGAGRFCRQFHSLQVTVANKSTGEIVADLRLMTDFGASRDNNTDLPLNVTCPQGVPTPSQVAPLSTGTRTIKVQPDLNGYEPWRSADKGLILGLSLAGLTFDTVTPITGCTDSTCTQMIRIGQNVGEQRLFAVATDPGGPALSIDASKTPGGGGEFFTDIYGKKLLLASDPGAVRQYVKPGLRLEVRNERNSECFTRDAFFMFYEGCGNAPQSSMNIEGALSDKN